MKTIALTGATSMLGVALIDECLKNDVKVIALIRKGSKRMDRLPVSDIISVVYCDIDELDRIETARLSADVFYHVGWSFTDKIGRNSPSLQEKNIKYTLDAVHLAARLGCKRFIGTGSQAEYGRVDVAIKPDTPVNPDIAYGIAKFASGLLSHLECSSLGIEHIWVRVFSVYGTNDNEGTLLRTFIEKVQANAPMPLTKCEQVWDFLHEEDAGRALYAIGQSGIANSVYCLGSGEAKQLLSYLEEAKNIVNPDYRLMTGELPYGKQQVMHLCADISDLKRDTGWQPRVSFSDGIRKLIGIL